MVIESCPYLSMLIEAKFSETIFRVSRALVQHAERACKLGLARLV
jgi:hypothetical protein